MALQVSPLKHIDYYKKERVRAVLLSVLTFRGPGIAHRSRTDSLQRPHAEYEKYANSQHTRVDIDYHIHIRRLLLSQILTTIRNFPGF